MVMTTGTLWRTQMSRSSSSRSLPRRTEMLAPQGAALESLASAASICATQASNAAGGRALAAGTVPTIPALQHAITSSGPETRNIGAAMTGRRRRPCRMRGSGIRGDPSWRVALAR
jgi:hypothetical protein